MFRAALQSIGGFLTGKLLANPAKTYALLGLGIAVSGAILVVAAKLGGPLWADAAVAGFAGGMLQPRLYKTLRYR